MRAQVGGTLGGDDISRPESMISASSTGVSPDWRPFTPQSVSPRLCHARMWNGGRGGQCEKPTIVGSLCGRHTKQESERGLTYGRVDQDGPHSKLREFERAAVFTEGRPGREPGVDDREGAKRPQGAGRQGGEPQPPAAKRRAAPRSEQWLMADGTVAKKAPQSVGARAWIAEDLWSAALGRRQPVVHASAPGADEPWASMAVGALLRSGPRVLDGGGPAGSGEVHMQISSDAVDLVGKWLVGWLEKLLRELHTLSMQRVNLYDDAGTADTPRALPQGAGCVRRQHGSTQGLGEDWLQKLQRDQLLRRIEPADVRALLQGPGASTVCALCSIGLAPLQRSLLEIFEQEELRSGIG